MSGVSTLLWIALALAAVTVAVTAFFVIVGPNRYRNDDHRSRT